jgi:hypothetical protein
MRSSARSAQLALALALATFAAPVGPARAQDPPPPAPPAADDASARADALFEEGRALASKGDYEAACAKFQESHGIRPGIGTLFNLAECHEKTGKLALAYREYTEVVERTKAALQADREKIARERLAALEQRVPVVTVEVPGDAKDLTISIDGQPLPPEAWNVAQPLDPGDHTLRVQSGKNAPTEETFSVAAGDPPKTLSVSAEEGVKTRRNTGLIVTGSILMGVGLVGLAVAGYQIDRDGEPRAGSIITAGGGLACVGVGVPLFIIGLRKRPVEEERKRGERVEGPRSAFVGAEPAPSPVDLEAGPIPALGIGPGSASAHWVF